MFDNDGWFKLKNELTALTLISNYYLTKLSMRTIIYYSLCHNKLFNEIFVPYSINNSCWEKLRQTYFKYECHRLIQMKSLTQSRIKLQTKQPQYISCRNNSRFNLTWEVSLLLLNWPNQWALYLKVKILLKSTTFF